MDVGDFRYLMHRLCHPNEGGYTKQQIFNVDETVFYWKISSRTLIVKRGEVNAWFQSFKGQTDSLVGR